MMHTDRHVGEGRTVWRDGVVPGLNRKAAEIEIKVFSDTLWFRNAFFASLALMVKRAVAGATRTRARLDMALSRLGSSHLRHNYIGHNHIGHSYIGWRWACIVRLDNIFVSVAIQQYRSALPTPTQKKRRQCHTSTLVVMMA